MFTVSVRFYGRLNDLLPPARRGARFTVALRERAAVKDTLEGLGVPHPEIDIIIVNGEPVAFDCRLAAGDIIAVYPAFETLETRGLLRVGEDPPRPVRFVADVHLGKLASLLRVAGFDTARTDEDDELARRSADEARVALTRDVGLLKRSLIQYGSWIRHTAPALQLVEVLGRYRLVGEMRPFSRCPRCNTPLVPAGRADVLDRLPPRTSEEFSAFHQCPGCRQVYWQGTHYRELQRLLDRARECASRSGSEAGRYDAGSG